MLTSAVCKATNKRGAPCGMPRVNGGDFCFQHEPTMRAKANAARTLGGRRRKRPDHEPAAPTTLRSINDAVTELEVLADDAKRLHHGAERIKVLLAIVRASIDAHSDHTLERRIAELEERARGASHLKRA